MNRLLEKYRNEIIPQMMEKEGYKNRFQVPRIIKIIVNMGIGAGTQDAKLVEDASKELAIITGQYAVITKSRKSIAGFKLRQGQPVGCKVTLRGVRMYEFLDRFISVAVPRIRDFRGFPVNSFDKKGNYSFGLKEQTMFPELDLDRIKRVQGMDITIVTTAKDAVQAKKMLDSFGFPFSKTSEKE